MMVSLLTIGCTISLLPGPSERDIVTTARSKLFAPSMCRKHYDVRLNLLRCYRPRFSKLGPDDLRDRLEACVPWDSADDWRAPRDWPSLPWSRAPSIWYAERVSTEPFPADGGHTFRGNSSLPLSVGQPATAAHFRNVADEILHHGGTCEGPIDADGVPLRCRVRLETVMQYRWDDWKAPISAALLLDLTVVFPGPPVGDSVAFFSSGKLMSISTRRHLTHLSRAPNATLILIDPQAALLDQAGFEAHRSRILASGGIDCRATDVPDFAAAGAE